ncbi:MAG: transcription termination factor NusA [Elusimicrobia bacterium GWC2_51_8]|nr:MAG: transcription termination factor NusA [Elusimicrobia bacterium GWA2_51_34]OGR58422.1 MAG: transcription termination factor NusA [Elusimicrobia bacterium GWC2_51_8]OGR87426.1 MAG: transcription termination factor NusA [Elusimicrobia bacterium GWF2_52_66]
MTTEKVFKGKSELMVVLEQLEREKGILREDVFKTITDALVSALRKYFGKTAQITATIDPETAEMKGFLVKKVVKQVFTDELEITLEEARKKNPKAKLDDDLSMEVGIQDFSRIAAQTAKQVLVQKIREIEKVKVYEEFKPREGEIVTGLVHHLAGRDIFVDMGKTEAILPYGEQIRREHYTMNQRVRAIIHRVDKENKGLQIVLSRASTAFMKGLFEAEIPEIAEKVVEIVDIVRDPGFRAKVLVKSNSTKVDPVGACVGIRGSRIRVIMSELSNEKIDLIPYIEDTMALLAKAFAPATVSSVRVLDKESKKAMVIVPDDQLAIAIGREGQNIRLVSRLTGWQLEVKSEGQKLEEVRKNTEASTQDLLQIEGIGPKAADTLVKVGMNDIRKLSALSVADLTSFEGIGEKTAQKIISGAQKFIKEHPDYGNPQAKAASAAVDEDASEAEQKPPEGDLEKKEVQNEPEENKK